LELSYDLAVEIDAGILGLGNRLVNGELRFVEKSEQTYGMNSCISGLFWYI